MSKAEIEYESSQEEDEKDVDEENKLAQKMSAASVSPRSSLTDSLNIVVELLNNTSSFSPEEIGMISAPYKLIRERLDTIIKGTSSRKSMEPPVIQKKEQEKEITEKQTSAEFADEIRKEVEHCALISDHLSFKERANILSKAIDDAIHSMRLETTPKLQSIDECDAELTKAFIAIKHIKKLLLGVRIHCGFLWIRQQEIAMDTFAKGEKIQGIVNGTVDMITDLTKYKKYQCEKYHAHHSDMSRCMALARISKKFPEIINTEKTWSWFKKAVTNDKLSTAVNIHLGIDE